MAPMGAAALGTLGSGLFSIGLRVLAEGTCPSAAAIELQLAPLLPHGAKLEGLIARIEPLDELLRVEVRSDGGGLLTVRDLERSAPCPALAAAAAVVIASAVSSLPLSAPPIAAPHIPRPPPDPPPLPPRQPKHLLWEIGAGGGLILTHHATTGSGLFELQLAPFGKKQSGRFGFRLAAMGSGLRRQALDESYSQSVAGSTGFAEWTRLAVLLAPRYRWLADRPLVEFYAGFAGAVVLVQGSNLPRTDSSQAADFGISAGLRLGRAWQHAALWAEVGLMGWLRPQDLSLVNQPPSARLPAWDILLSVGLSAGRLQRLSNGM